jgi:hypothetical protein
MRIWNGFFSIVVLLFVLLFLSGGAAACGFGDEAAEAFGKAGKNLNDPPKVDKPGLLIDDGQEVKGLGKAAPSISDAVVEDVDDHEEWLKSFFRDSPTYVKEGVCYGADAAEYIGDEVLVPSDPDFSESIEEKRAIYHARVSRYRNYINRSSGREQYTDQGGEQLRAVGDSIYGAQSKAERYGDRYARLLHKAHVDTVDKACKAWDAFSK